MNDRIVTLKTFGMKTSDETIALLREVLAEAEAGEIVAVAIAAIEPNGASRTRSTSSDHFQGIIGALSILQHRMIAEARMIER